MIFSWHLKTDSRTTDIITPSVTAFRWLTESVIFHAIKQLTGSDQQDGYQKKDNFITVLNKECFLNLKELFGNLKLAVHGKLHSMFTETCRNGITKFGQILPFPTTEDAGN